MSYIEINLFLLLSEMHCVFCEVETDLLNVNFVHFNP